MRVGHLIEVVGGIGDQPGDSDEERLQHRFLIGTGVVMSFGGLLWGVLALSLGLWWQSLIPFGYTLVTAGNLVFLSRTKRFRVVRTVQVSISLVLPFLFQWSLGGWVPSGATMLWAMLTLTASQSFESRRSSLRWLALFVGLVIVSAVIDSRLTVPDILQNDQLSVVLFTVNVSVVSLAVFVIVSYFMYLRRQATMELGELNQEIAESQQALVQSEKLAALGRLSAGMAHELNNPAAAAARGAKHLKESIHRGWRSSIDVGLLSLDRGQAEELLELERLVEQQMYAPTTLDALERSDVEQAIEDWCESAQVQSAPDPAVMLEAGLTPPVLVELEEVFPVDDLPAVLHLAAGLYERESLAEQVNQGTERIAVLVKALKSYTDMDRSERRSVDVNAGINDTLIMMQGALKRGVVVNRDLEPGLPNVEANGGELNQVWTNLIDNAIDAMDGSGRLDITTRSSGSAVEVTIEDDGPGIPTDLQDAVFDPFVTTKPVGTGTGLGLNISRNIVVERHSGSIDIASEPGSTRVTVVLPTREAERTPDSQGNE